MRYEIESQRNNSKKTIGKLEKKMFAFAVFLCLLCFAAFQLKF